MISSTGLIYQIPELGEARADSDKELLQDITETAMMFLDACALLNWDPVPILEDAYRKSQKGLNPDGTANEVPS
jgi:hypothetical protein